MVTDYWRFTPYHTIYDSAIHSKKSGNSAITGGDYI